MNITPFIFLGVASLLLLSFLGYLGLTNDRRTKQNSVSSHRMQYALVNEDKGATFEGKRYSLGNDFVTLINKDINNRWETTTRNIAMSGVESGQFDAQIIIPQDFSEKLLSLQAIAPEKAEIEYQVRDGQNEMTNQMIQNQVNNILKEFNQRVIKMYFSSIVGNLVEAQQSVNQIVNTLQGQQINLENDIYRPFKEIPTSYTDVLNTASILDENNKLFTTEQEAFVNSVQSLLNSNNENLEATSETAEETKQSIEEYSKEANEKIKKSIEQFNDQFEVQKKQLTNQWQKDTEQYGEQFDQLNASVLTQFGNFYTPSVQGDTGVYAEFLTQSKVFQETQSNRIRELQNEITELLAQIDQLNLLKKQIAQTYYHDTEATPDTATDEQIKQAIVELISDGKSNTPNLDENYQKKIEELLTQISYDSLEKLVNELEANGVLPTDQATIFRNELKIVEKYAKEYGIIFDTNTHFAYLEPKQTHNGLIDVPKKKITFSLDTRNENTISLNEKNSQNGKMTFSLNEPEIQQIKTELNNQLASVSYEIDIVGITDKQFTITQPEKVNDGTIVKRNNQENGSELLKGSDLKMEETTLPNKLTLSIEIPLTWHLTSKQQETSYNTIDYTWSINDGIQLEDSFSTYIPMDQLLMEDLPQLMKQFQLLDTVAQQVVTIYGTPNKSLSIQEYATMLEAHENQDKRMEELAGKDSIYWMYDNITGEEQEEMITDKLAKRYKKTGGQLYKDTEEQINKLQKVIGKETDQNTTDEASTLYGILNLMTVPEKLLQEAGKLNGWYTEATRIVNETYENWQETEQEDARSVINETNQHPEENDSSMIKTETDRLVEAMQSLIKTSNETSAMTIESAAKVKDIGPTIKELKADTTEVQDNAETILSNLDVSMDESKETTSQNEEYAKTFEKVLANTRDGGADNSQVFNFLSGPIEGEGVFSETRQASLVPYYVTLIGAILILLMSIVLQGLMRNRMIKEEDAFVEPTRYWQNIPNIMKIIFTTISIMGITSVLLTLYVASSNEAAWFSYSFLVFSSVFLILLGCMRQVKKITLYIYGAFLGLFFMLTPLLGIATKPGSLSNWFYRISPFQNIQNGFTVLVNGGSISWISYSILIILLILGVTLNLFVRPEGKKGMNE